MRSGAARYYNRIIGKVGKPPHPPPRKGSPAFPVFYCLRLPEKRSPIGPSSLWGFSGPVSQIETVYGLGRVKCVNPSTCPAAKASAGGRQIGTVLPQWPAHLLPPALRLSRRT